MFVIIVDLGNHQKTNLSTAPKKPKEDDKLKFTKSKTEEVNKTDITEHQSTDQSTKTQKSQILYITFQLGAFFLILQNSNFSLISLIPDQKFTPSFLVKFTHVFPLCV